MVLYELVGRKPDAVMALEIGGGNGLQGKSTSTIDLSSVLIVWQDCFSARPLIWTYLS